MSTNSECVIVKVTEPNKADRCFYILENYDAPKNAFDWMDYASVYGPFRSDEAAEEHLFENHANPGSFGHVTLTMAQVKASEEWNKRLFGPKVIDPHD